MTSSTSTSSTKVEKKNKENNYPITIVQLISVVTAVIVISVCAVTVYYYKTKASEIQNIKDGMVIEADNKDAAMVVRHGIPMVVAELQSGMEPNLDTNYENENEIGNETGNNNAYGYQSEQVAEDTNTNTYKTSVDIIALPQSMTTPNGLDINDAGIGIGVGDHTPGGGRGSSVRGGGDARLPMLMANEVPDIRFAMAQSNDSDVDADEHESDNSIIKDMNVMATAGPVGWDEQFY
jgi:hypothetical protein